MWGAYAGNWCSWPVVAFCDRVLIVFLLGGFRDIFRVVRERREREREREQGDVADLVVIYSLYVCMNDQLNYILCMLVNIQYTLYVKRPAVTASSNACFIRFSDFWGEILTLKKMHNPLNEMTLSFSVSICMLKEVLVMAEIFDLVYVAFISKFQCIHWIIVVEFAYFLWFPEKIAELQNAVQVRDAWWRASDAMPWCRC